MKFPQENWTHSHLFLSKLASPSQSASSQWDARSTKMSNHNNNSQFVLLNFLVLSILFGRLPLPPNLFIYFLLSSTDRPQFGVPLLLLISTHFSPSNPFAHQTIIANGGLNIICRWEKGQLWLVAVASLFAVELAGRIKKLIIKAKNQHFVVGLL